MLSAECLQRCTDPGFFDIPVFRSDPIYRVLPIITIARNGLPLAIVLAPSAVSGVIIASVKGQIIYRSACAADALWKRGGTTELLCKPQHCPGRRSASQVTIRKSSAASRNIKINVLPHRPHRRKIRFHLFDRCMKLLHGCNGVLNCPTSLAATPAAVVLWPMLA